MGVLGKILSKISRRWRRKRRAKEPETTAGNEDSWPQKLERLKGDGDDDNPPGRVENDDAPGSLSHLFCIDLKLSEERYPPTTLEEYLQQEHQSSCKPFPSKRLADSHISQLSYAAGSCSETDQVFYNGQDTGLWQCIHEAWQNHWNLRTCPEDWWLPIARRISKAITTLARMENDQRDNQFSNSKDKRRQGESPVCDLFIGSDRVGNDKQVIEVAVVDELGPQESNDNSGSFDAIFQEIQDQIQNALQLPSFASEMTANFSTSTSTHVIASQINLMEGLQEFFEYSLRYCLCGLKGIELMGTLDDWKLLRSKFQRIRELLAPIMTTSPIADIVLPKEWWDCVEMVLDHLVLTMEQPELVGPFWRSIIFQAPPHVDIDYYNQKGKGHRHREEVDAYDGWLVRFLVGDADSVGKNKLEDIVVNAYNPVNEMSGLCQAPLNVSLEWCDPTVTEQVQLVGGIMGFTCHHADADDTMNGAPSLQPHHMWAMLVSPTSKLRNAQDLM